MLGRGDVQTPDLFKRQPRVFTLHKQFEHRAGQIIVVPEVLEGLGVQPALQGRSLLFSTVQ
jgi:hypothetical protein